MRKKKIIRLLRNADEKTIEQISREYPGLTDTDREALFQRIVQEMQTIQTEQAKPEDEEHFSIMQESRFSRMFSTAAVAACILVFCGTFAGLSRMKGQVQSPQQPEPSEEMTDSVNDHVYAIGEHYAADQLTQSGTIWLTVTETAFDGDLFRVNVTMKNEDAVSIADAAIGEPYLFMADNFMAATGQIGNNWIAVQPCQIMMSNVQEGLPNTVTLHPGESCELVLWFQTEKLPAEWKLITSYSTAYPYTVITMKEDE